MKKIKIIADNKIPYLKGALESVADIVYLPGSKITKQDLADADALITRTRTKCNKELLEGTGIKFIATATIGYDHIDTAYCDAAGISWTNAPGCNSGSVQQYVASALVLLSRKNNFELKSKTIGIVGVGNVGSKVQKIAEAFGMKVLLCDPPRERKEGSANFVSFETICKEADIITFHTPLNKTGTDKTFHLADDAFFQKVKKGVIIINSSRGEVVETNALKQALRSGIVNSSVIDVWENEPDIDKELLALVTIATPHIAGYSRDGKAGGTTMSVQAVSRFFGLGIDNWQPADIEKPSNPSICIDTIGKTIEQVIQDAIRATYKIAEDDKRLKADVATFEKQREDYPVRREFHAYNVEFTAGNAKALELIKTIGFKQVLL